MVGCRAPRGTSASTLATKSGRFPPHGCSTARCFPVGWSSSLATQKRWTAASLSPRAARAVGRHKCRGKKSFARVELEAPYPYLRLTLFSLLPNPSVRRRRRRRPRLCRVCDVLSVDGEHTVDAVIRDWRTFRLHLNSHAIIFFNDGETSRDRTMMHEQMHEQCVRANCQRVVLCGYSALHRGSYSLTTLVLSCSPPDSRRASSCVGRARPAARWLCLPQRRGRRQASRAANERVRIFLRRGKFGARERGKRERASHS